MEVCKSPTALVADLWIWSLFPNVGLIMQNITISTKYFVNLIRFLDSMIILLLKTGFQESFKENNAFYVFRYQLII